MERKKPGVSIDELALVKAAAWAWYQHGSGSEGRPMHEFDLTRSQRAPKPSRYKIEAMKEYESFQESEKISLVSSPPNISPLSSEHTSEISLLDSYEIERISRQLDYYIKSSRDEYYGSFLGSHDRRGHRRVASISESETREKKSKQKKKNRKGFWLVVCGSRHDDVLDGRSLRLMDSRWPEKHVTVVETSSCRPRGNIPA